MFLPTCKRPLWCSQHTFACPLAVQSYTSMCESTCTNTSIHETSANTHIQTHTWPKPFRLQVEPQTYASLVPFAFSTTTGLFEFCKVSVKWSLSNKQWQATGVWHSGCQSPVACYCWWWKKWLFINNNKPQGSDIQIVRPRWLVIVDRQSFFHLFHANFMEFKALRTLAAANGDP
jgi:hypothetical protein